MINFVMCILLSHIGAYVRRDHRYKLATSNSLGPNTSTSFLWTLTETLDVAAVHMGAVWAEEKTSQTDDLVNATTHPR